jgi:hypothetical protein
MTGTAGEWLIALVPCNRTSSEVDLGRAIFMLAGTSVEQQSQFYGALTDIPWLCPNVRRVVMKKLGRSLREEKRAVEYARTVTLQHLIDERKKRLREQGYHPRGGVHDRAVAEIAAEHGIPFPTLKKRLERKRRRKPTTRLKTVFHRTRM